MYSPAIVLLYLFVLFVEPSDSNAIKRALQKEHEKPQAEKWYDKFIGKRNDINYQLTSLVQLLHTIANHLDNCTTMILYDSTAEHIDRIILEELFKGFPTPFIHGRISDNDVKVSKNLGMAAVDICVSYLLLLKDVMKTREIIGKQRENKIVIVSRSSQWRVHEFLSSDSAQDFVNLLIICKSEQLPKDEEVPYVLYTHKMYIDGLGSSKPHILMSWFKNKLSKPSRLLFPKKMKDGFSGHRFIVIVADQPPYVIKRGTKNKEIVWDGLEIRLVQFFSEILNFTTEFQEAKDFNTLGATESVAKMLATGKANIGLAGLYVTKERIDNFEISHGHSQDCAVFISLTSTALPRYRAILGPFHWTVWLALTLTYLFAIFPIAFSDRLTLVHLIKRPEEMENMFWYVFGTFTNCFSFAGKDSWSKTKKPSTRMFIGWYWVFTIIVSACYTGSIIAFVTLPVFPETVDTAQQLISGHFQLGTLDKGGWQYWFENSTDKKTTRLFKNLEYLPDVQSGIHNITRAFFWPYAFLGSRDQLDFIVRTNYTSIKKRAVLHISSECFAPFSVSMGFPKNSVYKNSINAVILRAVQSGLIIKMKNDMEFDIMRSATGKLLQANSVGKVREQSADDRALTIQDTQGMFLLLAAGFIMGGASLISEWLGGCFKFCKTGRRSRNPSISTNRKSFHVPTPNNKSNSDFEQNNSGNNLQTPRNLTTPEYCQDRNNSVLVHKELEFCDHPDKISQMESASQRSTDESSDLDYEISRLFNFDYLFGENNSVSSEEPESPYSDNAHENSDDIKNSSNENSSNKDFEIY